MGWDTLKRKRKKEPSTKEKHEGPYTFRISADNVRKGMVAGLGAISAAEPAGIEYWPISEHLPQLWVHLGCNLAFLAGIIVDSTSVLCTNEVLERRLLVNLFMFGLHARMQRGMHKVTPQGSGILIGITMEYLVPCKAIPHDLSI